MDTFGTADGVTEFQLRSPPGEYAIATQIAFQHALAEQTATDGTGGVGVLQLDGDAVTIGVSQDPETVDWDAVDRWDLDVGRRLTLGGGHYHHEGKLTYAMILPVEALASSADSPSEAIGIVQDPIVDALERMGIEPRFPTKEERSGSHTVCRAGGANGPTDLLVDGRKIAGTGAHFEFDGVIVAHGAIDHSLWPEREVGVFETDATPEDLRREVTSVKEHVDIDREAALTILEESLHEWADARPVEWSEDELDRVQELAERRYSTDKWIMETQKWSADLTEIRRVLGGG